MAKVITQSCHKSDFLNIFAAQNKTTMKIIGREREIAYLNELYSSQKSEFVVVYGRRRVGKTFLIKENFRDRILFSFSGMANSSTSEQLVNFNITLRKTFKQDVPPARNWLEAFAQLAEFVEQSTVERKVIFIDELPWLDTPRSRFLPAFENFWNQWASSREDIMLIICGSATSWITNKIINNHGGLHNRLTFKIHLEPFTLAECQEFFDDRGMDYSQLQIAECYMAMGGIPYYLDKLQKGYSVAQNINRLFFDEGAILSSEFTNLYASLFHNYEDYKKIVETLSKKTKGLTRDEIIEQTNLKSNGELTKILSELESCGFIRSYTAFGKKERDKLHQLTDFYTLFYFQFIKPKAYDDENYWLNILGTPTYNTWAGYSFEMLCLHHIKQIKTALGISGILTAVCSWKSKEFKQAKKDGKEATNGAQIDLVIDRKDRIINLCEMKFSDGEYVITKDYDANLLNKKLAFKAEALARSSKSVHLTLITTFGVKTNMYIDRIQSQVVLSDLFK